jgi:hypothetical protein
MAVQCGSVVYAAVPRCGVSHIACCTITANYCHSMLSSCTMVHQPCTMVHPLHHDIHTLRHSTELLHHTLAGLTAPMRRPHRASSSRGGSSSSSSTLPGCRSSRRSCPSGPHQARAASAAPGTPSCRPGCLLPPVQLQQCSRPTPSTRRPAYSATWQGTAAQCTSGSSALQTACQHRRWPQQPAAHPRHQRHEHQSVPRRLPLM